MGQPIQVIVEIRGGMLCTVYASDPDVQVELLDWDNVHEGSPADKEQGKALEEKAKGMHEVW